MSDVRVKWTAHDAIYDEGRQVRKADVREGTVVGYVWDIHTQQPKAIILEGVSFTCKSIYGLTAVDHA